jgi:hypothetical protein
MPIPRPWFAPDYDYFSNGSSYDLSLINPYQMLSGWSFDSDGRQWKVED